MRMNHRVWQNMTWVGPLLALAIVAVGPVTTAAAPAESPLVEAARSGDLERVRALLGGFARGNPAGF